MERFGECIGRGFGRSFRPDLCQSWALGSSEHGGWWTVGEFLPLVLLLVLVGLVVWAVLRVTRHDRAPVASVAGVDQALSEARLRYARGDMTRDEFLEKSRDLGGTVQLPEQPSSKE